MDNQFKRSMTMTRIRLKGIARLQYGLNIRCCILVALIGSVLTYLFSTIISMRLPTTDELMAATDMTVYMWPILRANLLNIAFGLLIAPLTIGSYGIFTQIIRNEKPAVSSLFNWLGEGYKMKVAYLGYLVYMLITVGWGALLIGVPYAAFLGLGYWLEGVTMGAGMTVLYSAAGIAVVALMVVGYAKVISYQPILYFMGIEPEKGVRHALMLCRQSMKGHIWEYFWYQLSFLGWQLIASFTCGLGMLFVTPYTNLANAAFCEYVRGNQVVQPMPPQMPKFPHDDEDDTDDDDGEEL